jgi:predicted nucleotide-binding protein (sugar kinase/HSP70/actin superfamily)
VHLHRDVDVICDVGGQDIKIMLLQDGQVKDFKLNTQCSAGNGYFLQRVAQQFDIAVEDYADVAFRAQRMPTFSYGCAVFLQSDIVNFQRQGWRPEEIMAGLAAILPKNIWLYVARIPNFATLGRTFVLQGGTQRNLAAVKAQVDFIRARLRGRGEEPRILVHEHCGEAGAIGAALEALRTRENGRPTGFVGFEALAGLRWTATTNESTVCRFCRNRCQRTFLDIELPGPKGARRRLITGNSCEKGSVEDVEQVRAIKADLDGVFDRTENLAEIVAREAFRSFAPASEHRRTIGKFLTRRDWRRASRRPRRRNLRIGIPRALNVYSVAPFLTAWLESLGVRFRNIVFSDVSSEGLYREGCTRASIDPCFPSKLGIPHVHNLIHKKHERNALDAILFPMLDDLPSDLVGTMACRVCPTITATPTAVRAAFRKDGDLFARKGIEFLCPFLNVAQPALLERQLYDQLGAFLGLTRAENADAVRAGYSALERHRDRMRDRALAVIQRLEREQGLGIVVLGRPYHADPGINHGIFRELQKRGYPIFTTESLPVDPDFLDPLFGDEVRKGLVASPLDISDVWKNSFNSVSNRKLWAAKVVARHPNLVGLELSSFRCGHDAPIYGVVQEIVETSGTPFFTFRDLDENHSAGSIRIRIETIDYSLRRYREALARHREPALAGSPEG